MLPFGQIENCCEGKRGLDNLLAKVKGADIEIYIVVGHTDSIGTDEYNRKLSLRRADSVKNYLVSQGVPQIKIRADGRGESEPVASNKTAGGRSQNRRVEVTVVPTGYKGPLPASTAPNATAPK